jgi:hypothetical protein
VTPLIVLTPQSVLSLETWVDSELSAFYVDSAYDGGIVEISENGGPFTQITPTGGYNKTIRWVRGVGSPYTGPFPGTPCFGGATAWLKKNFDLGAFADDSVRFRFRFGSDSGTQREGWYLDNFVVRGEALPPLPPDPPLPVDSLVIQAVGSDAVLSWEMPDSTITRFIIYRSTFPEFDPTPLDSIGGTDSLHFMDSGILAADSLSRFYRVKSVKD